MYREGAKTKKNYEVQGMTLGLGSTNRGGNNLILYVSVADPEPDPDPLDPHIFGAPGSGSISTRYGSGSGPFYHQTKIKKNLDSY